MAGRLCPWWLGYALVSPIRRFRQDPATILGPFLSEGMLVLEPGCGMGFFTLELARLVGPAGKVVAVDIQEKMLRGLRRRSQKAGLADRIDARLSSPGAYNVDDLAGRVDFAFAFAVVHELPDPEHFYAEMFRALRPGAKMLVAEPKAHVKPAQFVESMKTASRVGFRITDGPVINASRCAVLEREGGQVPLAAEPVRGIRWRADHQRKALRFRQLRGLPPPVGNQHRGGRAERCRRGPCRAGDQAPDPPIPWAWRFPPARSIHQPGFRHLPASDERERGRELGRRPHRLQDQRPLLALRALLP